MRRITVTLNKKNRFQGRFVPAHAQEMETRVPPMPIIKDTRMQQKAAASTMAPHNGTK
jgi:hypothetical protein